MSQKILFIDRDGTLIEEPADEQVDEISKVRLVHNVISALQDLRDAGFLFVMVSNQDGLGTESFPQNQFEPTHRFVVDLFESQGIQFIETFICPHFEADGCDCRKPKAGLLTRFLAATSLDLSASAVIGDRDSDIGLADAIGVPGYRLNEHQSWSDIARQLIERPRTATVKRVTNETQIQAVITLDSANAASIETGIGFFDHMLEQIAKHAGFSLALTCDGDLDVDDHHSIEDVALALGAGLREALGDKRGIGRYGFTVPMDETLATVAIDLSGRPAFRMKADFGREKVGGLATEMVGHFFQSLAQSMGAAIHIQVEGENAHHMVEACFKGVGRALRPALAQSGRDMPSTKGSL
ncbi:MAG: bifunctional histidinol-phosphatase/imidazoleglycerol-phosphate dehydratase HisB [Woeseiaceae bacterium]